MRFAPLLSTCESAGEGSTRFLAADACELVSRWIGSAKLTEGALFRAIDRGYPVGDRLSNRGVARSFKRPGSKRTHPITNARPSVNCSCTKLTTES